VIIFGWRSKYVDEATGYMFCPECRARKPAAAGTRKTYFTLFFVSLFPVATHEAYHRCEGCQGLFDPDAKFPYDFGDHADPKVWSCYHCGSPNLSHQNRCGTCGAG
jgi:hypothetical protein